MELWYIQEFIFAGSASHIYASSTSCCMGFTKSLCKTKQEFWASERTKRTTIAVIKEKKGKRKTLVKVMKLVPGCTADISWVI